MTDISDDDMKKFQKLAEMFPEAELDPELKLYMDEIPGLGPCIKHPLVFSVPHFDAMNHQLNEQLKHKKEVVKKALDHQDYSRFVFMHERPYRIEAFDQVCDDISDDQMYWKLVSDIWSDTENAYQNYDRWRDFWCDDRPGRENAMDDDEKKFLASLQDEFEVYRGFSHDGADVGLSWTIDRKKAEWFALRFWHESYEAKGESPRIASVRIDKKIVKAYLSGRGESEVIVDPEDFSHPVKIEKVKNG